MAAGPYRTYLAKRRVLDFDPESEEDSESGREDYPQQVKIKEELKELLEDEAFNSRAAARKSAKKKPKVHRDHLVQGSDLPPLCPFCANCRPKEAMVYCKTHDCKGYFKFFHCGDFLWANAKDIRSRLPCGPPCNCRHPQPSAAIRDAATGKALWVYGRYLHPNKHTTN